MILHAGSSFLQSFACHQTEGTNKTTWPTRPTRLETVRLGKLQAAYEEEAAPEHIQRWHVCMSCQRWDVWDVSPLIFFDEVKRLKEAGEAEISFEETEMWALKSVKPVKPVTIQKSAVTTVTFIVLEENVLFPTIFICHSREKTLPFLHAKKQWLGRNSVAICMEVMRYFKNKVTQNSWFLMVFVSLELPGFR